MKYQFSKKLQRSAIACMAVLLLCPPASASAAYFADISQVPWSGGEASIYQASNLGLMVGEVRDGLSYFRPRDSVSLCETAQLAYKLLLNTGRTADASYYVSKWNATLSQYGIPNWARPAISFCLETGIVTTSELGSFMRNGSPAAATREQTIKILGRALVYGVPSYTLGGTLSDFTDSDFIAADARPYVLLLEKEGVVNGDNLGKFNPKKTINRTETAVLVSNLYPLLRSQSSAVPSSSKSGQIRELANGYVVLRDSTEYYYFASSVKYTLNGRTSSLSELQTLNRDGTTVNVTLTLDGAKQVTAITADTSTQSNTEGKVTNVTRHISDAGLLTLDGDRIFNIKDVDDVTIRINSKSRSYDAIMQLHDNGDAMDAVLTLDKDGYVTRITITTKGKVTDSDRNNSDKNKDEDGKIDSMRNRGSSKGEITVDGEKYTVEDVDDVDIDVTDGEKTITKWDDLLDAVMDEDKTIEVSLTIKNDYVTDIEGEVTKVEGRLVGWSNNSLKLKVDGTTYTYKFTASKADDISVDISGLRSVDTLEELIDYLDDEDPDLDKKVTCTLTLTLDGGKIDEVDGKYSD